LLRSGAATSTWLQTNFDCVCYAIGNHYPFHGEAIRLLEQHAGVVLLHDVCLVDLFAAWAMRQKSGRDMVIRRTLYDEAPAANASHEWLIRHQPLVEWPASMAIGAIVHAGHYSERVKRACRGPVMIAPVPAFGPIMPPAPARERGARMTIATLGHVNTNKLPMEVVEAIGMSPLLRQNCRYRLIGQADPPQQARLCARANQLGVRIEFTGWVSDDQFHAQMLDVDVVTCLRRPITEGASGTVIHAMRSGRPILVNDVGFFSELPDCAVIKLSADAAAPEISERLEFLFGNPDTAASFGEQARRWSDGRFTAKAYVDVLLPLIETVQAQETLGQVLAHSQARLASLGLDRNDLAAARLADHATQLFGQPGELDLSAYDIPLSQPSSPGSVA
jgi:glycosyltransferase involved in cell wall biosynthesis